MDDREFDRQEQEKQDWDDAEWQQEYEREYPERATDGCWKFRWRTHCYRCDQARAS